MYTNMYVPSCNFVEMPRGALFNYAPWIIKFKDVCFVVDVELI